MPIERPGEDTNNGGEKNRRHEWQQHKKTARNQENHNGDAGELAGIDHAPYAFDNDLRACRMPSATTTSAGNCFTAASASRSLQPSASKAFNTSPLADLW